jgi:hypothetical protein
MDAMAPQRRRLARLRGARDMGRTGGWAAGAAGASPLPGLEERVSPGFLEGLLRELMGRVLWTWRSPELRVSASTEGLACGRGERGSAGGAAGEVVSAAGGGD